MKVYLDMDGTVADLYQVPEWLPQILAEDTAPYESALPLPLLQEIHKIPREALGVITWGCKDSSREFLLETEEAKLEWLFRNGILPSVAWVVPYGTPKYKFAAPGDILVDDEETNRMEWQENIGSAYTPEEFTEILRAL